MKVYKDLINMRDVVKSSPRFTNAIFYKKPYWGAVGGSAFIVKSTNLTAIEKLKILGVFKTFLYIAFLNQRLQTGGLTGYDLEAWHININKFKKNGNFTSRDIKTLIVNLNNRRPEMGELSSEEMQFIYFHNDRNYIDVLANSLPYNGYVFDINLSGDILKDYEFINGFKRLLLQKGFASIANSQFNASQCNVWQVILDNYNKNTVPINTVKFCVTHRARQQSNFYLYKMLTMLEQWLIKRLPKSVSIEKTGRAIPKPSHEDEVIEPFDFVVFDDTILNPNASITLDDEQEFYTESFVFVTPEKDSKNTDSGAQNNENEPSDSDGETEVLIDNEAEETDKKSRFSRLFGSIKDKVGLGKKAQSEPNNTPKSTIPVPPKKKQNKNHAVKKQEDNGLEIDKDAINGMINLAHLQNVWCDTTAGTLFKVNLDYRQKSIENRGDNDGDESQITTA